MVDGSIFDLCGAGVVIPFGMLVSAPPKKLQVAPWELGLPGLVWDGVGVYWMATAAFSNQPDWTKNTASNGVYYRIGVSDLSAGLKRVRRWSSRGSGDLDGPGPDRSRERPAQPSRATGVLP